MQSFKNFFATHKQLVMHVGIALAIFLTVITIFGVLADEVHEGGTLRVDRSILLWINAHASPTLNTFFVGVTDFGGVSFVAALTAIIAIYLISKRKYLKTFMLVTAIGGAAVLNLTLKVLFERARPELWKRLVEEGNFSFPSGHAMASSALAFTIVALLWNTKWRVPSIILGALYVVTIGLSRLYLGVHYPTDIVGGWLVSFAWVLAVSIIVYTQIYRTRRAKGLPKKES